MRPIRAGALRHTVVINTETTTLNDDGTDTPTRTEVGRRDATITELGGSELFYARQTVADAEMTVEFRYFDGLRSDIHDLETVDGQRLNILSVKDVEMRHVKHVLLCKEVFTQGA